MKIEKLKKLNACKDAILFSTKFKTPKEAWENCTRGDWMLWIASQLNVDKRLLTLAKGKCAETVLYLMRDQRSKDAVQAAIDFGEGRINDKQLKKVAARAANTNAVNAAYVAYVAANANTNAVNAAYVAAYATNVAQKRNKLETADICRQILTDAVLSAYEKFE